MMALDERCQGSQEIVELSMPDNMKESAFQLDENYMIELTWQNAEKARRCIQQDTRYKTSADREYYASKGKRLSAYTPSEWETVIGLISTANSTRSPKASIRALAEYTYHNRDAFLQKLANGDISVVDDLTKANTPRREDSLISKICAYLCEYDFHEFHFVINDNVVRRILPYYLCYYKVDESLWKKHGRIKKLDNAPYSDIHAMIKGIQQSLSETLSLRDIDHILWYCYKNDAVRVAIANALVTKG